MYIYSLKNKNNLKEIYIGKTSNVKQRMYAHKSCAKRNIDRPIYNWINKIGFENIEINIELECIKSQVDEYEYKTIKKYEEEGYVVYNEQLTNNYIPLENMNKKFEYREEVWDLYNNTNLPREEIIEHFGISDSLLTKIIQEYGGSNIKGKLFCYYEEIQNAIMSGIPIRELAREYGVAKNSISNINTGITAYNPDLDYPLNKYVRDEVMKRFQFKSKV